MFVGREREEAAIGEFIAGAARHADALVVLGDPGIGKSTFIGLARRHARDLGLTVLACSSRRPGPR
jgi:hypothetical protein